MMTLYSGYYLSIQPTLPFFCCTKKAWIFEIKDVDVFNKPEDLADESV